VNLIQIQLKRNGVQIGIESIEIFLIIMMLKKENFFKKHKFEKKHFYPSTQNKLNKFQFNPFSSNYQYW
jgi:hypothetical protein